MLFLSHSTRISGWIPKQDTDEDVSEMIRNRWSCLLEILPSILSQLGKTMDMP